MPTYERTGPCRQAHPSIFYNVTFPPRHNRVHAQQAAGKKWKLMAGLLTIVCLVQEPTARGLFQQIVMGLCYLEHKGVENHGAN